MQKTFSEFYPDVSMDAKGLQRLFKQFSFPGGIPSHVAAEVPGSIHEIHRFHLVMAVVERVPRFSSLHDHIRETLKNKLLEHHEYIRRYGDDLPEIKEWNWQRDYRCSKG